MNQKEAEELSVLLIQISEKLDQSVAFVEDKDSEVNFLKYREAIAKVMGYLYFGAKEPLWERFPELKPENLDGPYQVNETIHKPKFYDRSYK